MNFDFSDEQLLFRRVITELVNREITPDIRQIVKNEAFPQTLYQKLATNGLIGMRIAKRFGGSEVEAVTAGLAAEELAKTSGSLACARLLMIPDVYARILMDLGKAEMEEHLPAICSGKEIVTAVESSKVYEEGELVVEANVSQTSDGYVANLGTRAAPFTDIADHAIVLHQESLALIIDAQSKSVKKVVQETAGLRGSRIGSFVLMNHKLSNSLAVRYRLNQIAPAIHYGWTAGSLMALGIALYCLELAAEFSKQRQAFGKPLAKYEAIQFKLAEDFSQIQAARTLCYRTLWLIDQKQDVSEEAAMCKILGNKVAQEVVDHALQIHGGAGYTSQLPIERCWRDIRTHRLLDSIDQELWSIVNSGV